MHMLCIPLLLFSVLSFRLSSSHHIVFKEISEMAGALSYIHAIVPINISGNVQAVDSFQRDIHLLQMLYQKKKQPSGTSYDDWFHQSIVDLFQLASSDAKAMLTTLNSLQDTLLPVAAKNTSAAQ
jgi:hypothetical protein